MALILTTMLVENMQKMTSICGRVFLVNDLSGSRD
jgi:hypothetical protein